MIYRGFEIIPSEGGFRFKDELLTHSGERGMPFKSEENAMDAIDKLIRLRRNK